MANPLVPTAVTDKNGRITTVHKRLEAPQSASKTRKVPAPVLSPERAPSAPQRTPLTPPEPLTPEETAKFNNWYRERLAEVQFNTRAVNGYVDILSPESKALAARILAHGAVEKKVLVSILTGSHRSFVVNQKFHHPDVQKMHRVLNTSLRVVEKLAHDDPKVMDGLGASGAVMIKKALDGYGHSKTIDERVPFMSAETQEELASIAAVTTCIAHAFTNGNSHQYRVGKFRDADYQQAEGVWLTNRHLDAFLRENPGQTPRVIEYMNTREMGTSAKDFKALVAYLQESEDFGVLEDGWL